MLHFNNHHLDLVANYLFAEVADRVGRFKQEHPDADVISLGIGDVTLPLAPAVTDAIRAAADDMSDPARFHGYGPYEGYLFLRDAVKDYYKGYGIDFSAEEIYISDGAKNDLGSILDLFSKNRVLIPDPVYPAYVDTSVMHGNEILYVDGTPENGFLPSPPDEEVGLIYLCSPNNPTGAVYDKDGLKQWVDYANKTGALILFDAAYERFIQGDTLPHSIFSVEGARTCAIEFCSLSKTAGFTGVRCGYTVIPKELRFGSEAFGSVWRRRLAAKYNGCSYISQKAAAAVFSERGSREIDEAIAYYRENAKIIAAELDRLGVPYFGGEHSPYIWFQCGKSGSWNLFDRMLGEGVVCTPGAGFGRNGEGFCRLTAFGDRDRIRAAVSRFSKIDFT